ncbi:MAG TPA: hypothetical protein DEF61_01825 [Firmicutes bacterium]|nr:hypothetical protein [Bacillota bacterium]HBM70259.1 hypothetical protein [Bacillota bacterium]HBX25014.1 hypothetical protein [Bacillota bacterium]
MEENLQINIKKLTDKNKALLIGQIYRQCLINLGKSPDYHVYDLSEDFLNANKNKVEGSFLRKVKDYYLTLDCLERIMFINDCLEKGRHYKFWYLNFYFVKDYSEKLKQCFASVAKAF